MTLIFAKISNNASNCFLLSDTAVATYKTDYDPDRFEPDRGFQSADAYDYHHVTKSPILSPRVAYQWAGNWISAFAIWKDLSQLDLSDRDMFLREAKNLIEDPDRIDVSCAVFWLDFDRVLEVHRCCSVIPCHDGYVLAAGSGAPRLIKIYNALSQDELDDPLFAIRLYSALNHDEMVHIEFELAQVGGCFELVQVSDNGWNAVSTSFANFRLHNDSIEPVGGPRLLGYSDSSGFAASLKSVGSSGKILHIRRAIKWSKTVPAELVISPEWHFLTVFLQNSEKSSSAYLHATIMYRSPNRDDGITCYTRYGHYFELTTYKRYLKTIVELETAAKTL